MLGDILHCYSKLIQVFVKTEKYDEAMKTFEKIKRFGLNSDFAQDVEHFLPNALTPALYFYYTLQVSK